MQHFFLNFLKKWLWSLTTGIYGFFPSKTLSFIFFFITKWYFLQLYLVNIEIYIQFLKQASHNGSSGFFKNCKCTSHLQLRNWFASLNICEFHYKITENFLGKNSCMTFPLYRTTEPEIRINIVNIVRHHLSSSNQLHSNLTPFPTTTNFTSFGLHTLKLFPTF